MEQSLEIPRDPEHHEAYWRIQRAGWICMLLVIIAALAGVFSHGPLARAEVSAGRLRLEYPRFGRMAAPIALNLTIAPPHGGETAAVSISRSYLAHFRVSGVLPEPDSVTGSGDRFVYLFRTNAGLPLHISIQMETQEGTFGKVSGEVHSTGRTLRFAQFFWP